VHIELDDASFNLRRHADEICEYFSVVGTRMINCAPKDKDRQNNGAGNDRGAYPAVDGPVCCGGRIEVGHHHSPSLKKE
jgi:hypothetical protein